MEVKHLGVKDSGDHGGEAEAKGRTELVQREGQKIGTQMSRMHHIS